MKKNLIIVIVILLFGTGIHAKETNISLAGKWQFRVDSAQVGEQESWFSQEFTEFVTLPGSMNTNGKGDPVTVRTPWTGSMWNKAWYEKEEYAAYRTDADTKVVFWLQPDKYYAGPAWYRREIVLPSSAADKVVMLYFERCHWATTVWIDGVKAGSDNSLATPHQFELIGLKPGKHSITVRIDNKVRDINPGVDAHSISDNTQSNWNGIIGEMSLHIRPMVYISHVKLIPDAAKKEVKAEIAVVNRSAESKSGTLILNCQPQKGKKSPQQTSSNQFPVGESVITICYQMKNDISLWDEFNPALYTFSALVKTDKTSDLKTETVGFRKLGTKGTQITMNDRPLYFRGTLECCIFPKTGFPPTEEKEWERIMTVCKSFGLNHIRFHSWCPPHAAFDAADKMGVYFQVECDAWAHVGNAAPIDTFIMKESERIVREYGNHPSFCLFTYGNEPWGPNQNQYLTDFVNHWKAKDRRFLMTTGAGWPALECNDYHCLPAPRIQGWGSGIKSIINSQTPSSTYDWVDKLSKTTPTISHEIGQWCVYPNLKERNSYTGVLKAKNFDIFEDRLRASGLLHLADSFLLASGKLQTLCYKADIEASLRTKGQAGFQLLDLHDFPGQGTALVGVLDPFWNEKGYVTAREYNRFCGVTVPLARLSRFIYHHGDTLKADVEVSHFGPIDLTNCAITWCIKTKQGKVVTAGNPILLSALPTGELTAVGNVTCPLQTDIPVQLEFEVTVGGRFSNSWDIWVYPHTKNLIKSPTVLVANKLDENVVNKLNEGGKVLFTPAFGTLVNQGKDSVVVGFSSIFWNTLWTNNQAPHTLGILCNPKHPALALFPTDFYSNYQWFDMMSRCNAIPLHKLGKNIQPIVRIIDDWFTARSFGMIVECRVGKGKLLICSADLLADQEARPAAKQLLGSLLNYMESDVFSPEKTVNFVDVRALVQ